MDDSSTKLQSLCKEHGFDTFHSFDSSWYNAIIEKEGHVQSGVLRKLPDSEYCYLIGSSKYIWPFFTKWLKKKMHEESSNGIGDDCDSDDGILHNSPFDTFRKEMILNITRKLLCQDMNDSEILGFDVFLSNNGKRFNARKGREKINECGDFLVSMQRVAIVTGSYWHDEIGSKICIHPEFGTWHAFSAVVVTMFDISESKTDRLPRKVPSSLPCPVKQNEINDAKILLATAMKINGYKPKTTNDESSKQNDENLLQSKISDETLKRIAENQGLVEMNMIDERKLAWINIRDCFSLGREEYRYSPEQLCYHYSSNTKILHDLMKKIH